MLHLRAGVSSARLHRRTARPASASLGLFFLLKLRGQPGHRAGSQFSGQPRKSEIFLFWTYKKSGF